MNRPDVLFYICLLTLVGVVLLLFGVGINTN
jgi:hypothetical protein